MKNGAEAFRSRKAAKRLFLRSPDAFAIYHCFYFDDPVADVQVALRIWNLDPDCGQVFVDEVIQVTFEAAGVLAPLLGPGDKLEIQCAISQLFQIIPCLRGALSDVD